MTGGFKEDRQEELVIRSLLRYPPQPKATTYIWIEDAHKKIYLEECERILKMSVDELLDYKKTISKKQKLVASYNQMIIDFIDKCLNSLRNKITPPLIKYENFLISDQDAFHKIILHNLRLVMSFAIKILYSFKKRGYISHSASVLDLFGWGIEGLIRSIKLFDISTGFEFSTYASQWIKQSIVRGCYDYDYNIIRKPNHLMEYHKKLSAILAKAEKNGVDISKDDLESLGQENIEDALLKGNDVNMRIVSLDSKIPTKNIGSYVSLDEAIEDERIDYIVSMENSNTQFNLKAVIRKIMQASKLTKRERRIIFLKFGEKDLTLEDIGKKEGVSRERIRQIVEEVLSKMRLVAKNMGMDSSII